MEIALKNVTNNSATESVLERLIQLTILTGVQGYLTSVITVC